MTYESDYIITASSCIQNTHFSNTSKMLVSLRAFLLCLCSKIPTKTFLVKTKEEIGNAKDYISKEKDTMKTLLKRKLDAMVMAVASFLPGIVQGAQ